MKISHKMSGTGLMSIGIVLISIAFGLGIYNIYDEKRAHVQTAGIMSQLQPMINHNSLEMLQDAIPDYVLDPTMDMPIMELEGNQYIGMIEIPDLSIALPVLSEWSYPHLKIAPCRYKGSAYDSTLILAAHNYESHFGRINELIIGSPIIFIDADGNKFEYEVIDQELLSSNDIDIMEQGEWDLTLFTCTYDARQRITIRCKLSSRYYD